LTLAAACSNLRQFNHAYRLCALAWQLVDGGWNPRPNNELRWCALRVVADVKWQEPGPLSDRLWTPAWMLAEYARIYAVVTEKMVSQPVPERDPAVREGLCWTEFVLLKMAARWLPKELTGLCTRFNRRWGASLAVGEAHFQHHEPVGGRLNFYWDFEICKRWVSGRLTRDELDHCHERLVRAALQDESLTSSQYLHGLALQYRYLAVNCSSLLEFRHA
jgi:hypothetical protein